jgi:hypothetical protein
MQDEFETEHFRILVAVADAGSLSKAALESGLSQPYISRVLTRLETQWGDKLFRRTGRGVVDNTQLHPDRASAGQVGNSFRHHGANLGRGAEDVDHIDVL